MWWLVKVRRIQKFVILGRIIKPPEFFTDSSEAPLKYSTQSMANQKINGIQTQQISEYSKLLQGHVQKDPISSD
jgi:hypothetical protein